MTVTIERGQRAQLLWTAIAKPCYDLELDAYLSLHSRSSIPDGRGMSVVRRHHVVDASGGGGGLWKDAK